ncbi:hypothetical protein RHSIM_Rhsim07G0114300 [Rhododendron simsii]|uniref:Uncharacterized protein n=1 Tax=Rhododendron simsii TaxID=118357 RepID=A0A834LLV8_RHOSS|nr:hypothetical protein RHSIM_Rhsim07G0114300 [Rhododendron simsii]
MMSLPGKKLEMMWFAFLHHSMRLPFKGGKFDKFLKFSIGKSDVGNRQSLINTLQNTSNPEHNISLFENRTYRKYITRETELWKRTEASDTERIEPNNPIPPRPSCIKLGLSSYAMQYMSKLKSATVQPTWFWGGLEWRNGAAGTLISELKEVKEGRNQKGKDAVAG